MLGSVVVGPKHSGLHRLCWRTDTDLPRGQVTKDTGASTNQRTLTNRDTWGNIDIGPTHGKAVESSRTPTHRSASEADGLAIRGCVAHGLKPAAGHALVLDPYLARY